MLVTRWAHYAARAILHLAQAKGGDRSTTSDIAGEQHIPPAVLAKIIPQLSKAGLLHTSRGVHGGITLARAPKDITLLEVVEAIDGPIRLNECGGEGCTFDRDCLVQSVWCDAQNELIARLTSTDFAKLSERSHLFLKKHEQLG